MLHTWKGGDAKINGFLEDYAMSRTGCWSSTSPPSSRAGSWPPGSSATRSSSTSRTRRWLLRHERRSRELLLRPKEHPGRRGAFGRLDGRQRAAAAGRVHGRGRYAAPPKALWRCRRRDGAGASRLRPLARRARLHARAAARGRDRRRRPGRDARRGAGAYRPNVVVAAGHRARTAGIALLEAGRRWTVSPPPTCAGSSPASGRSLLPRSLRRRWTGRPPPAGPGEVVSAGDARRCRRGALSRSGVEKTWTVMSWMRMPIP